MRPFFPRRRRPIAARHVLGLATGLTAIVATAVPVVAQAPARAASAIAADAAPRAARTALVQRLDSLVDAFRAEGPVAGLTAAVVRGRDTLLLRGAGWADSAGGRRAGAATVYRIGSITKQFTAAAILQLVEQRRLALDDTLGRLLPQYPQWARVTLRQLLNHTSGIPSYTGRAAWQMRMGQALPPDSVIAFVAGDTLDFAPGTRFRYNNSGYVLLGMILERVTGQPYAALMQQRFFAPLGMRSASYCPDEPSAPTHARGYDRRGDGYAPTAPLSMTSPYAAGALCMDVPDYLRWQAALTGGRIVTLATFARMSRSDTLADGRPAGYGWGLAPDTIGRHRVVQHTGGINGFSTQQLWLPDDSLRVVVFANTLGSDPARLARNLAAAVLGEPLRPGTPRLAPVPLPAAVREAAVGRYLLQLGARTLPLEFRTEGDGLVSQAEGQGVIPLLYLGDDTFGASFDRAVRLRLVRGEDGRVTAVELRQNGAVVLGPRQP